MSINRLADHRFRGRARIAVACLALLAGFAGCGGSGGGGGHGGSSLPAIVVNSLLDDASPPTGTVTLRSALDSAASGQRITFDETLNDGTIDLIYVAEEHTVLVGEVMGFDDGEQHLFSRWLPRSGTTGARRCLPTSTSSWMHQRLPGWHYGPLERGIEDARVLAVFGRSDPVRMSSITGRSSVFDTLRRISASIRTTIRRRRWPGARDSPCVELPR